MNCPKIPDQPLKSPLLRLSLAVFGNLSVQLYPLKCTCRSKLSIVANLTWNFLLVVLALLKSYDWLMETYWYYDLPNVGEMYRIRMSKPFFAFLTILAERYFYPLTTMLNYAYYLFLSLQPCSPQTITSCLDDLLPEFYCSKAKSRKILAKVFLFYNALFALANYKIIYYDMNTFSYAYNIVSTYLIIFNRYSVALLVHYLQLATLIALREIIKRYKLQRIDFPQLKSEVVRLALLNERLSWLLSAPLIIFVISYVIDTLNGGVYMLSTSGRHVQPFHIQPSVHLLLIAYLEWKIQCQLLKLDFLLKREAFAGSLACKVWGTSSPSAKCPAEHSSDFRFYQLTLVSQYRRSFRLRLFRSLTDSFDWEFLFQIALFLFYYVVIMMQTST